MSVYSISSFTQKFLQYFKVFTPEQCSHRTVRRCRNASSAGSYSQAGSFLEVADLSEFKFISKFGFVRLQAIDGDVRMQKDLTSVPPINTIRVNPCLSLLLSIEILQFFNIN